MFVPLAPPPGDAQADFGEALVVIDGVERKAHYLVVDLPHSDDAFVKAFPAETTEAFCDGHNAAFRYFGGVPRRMVYDNTKLAVARMLGDGTRQRTRVFSELQSHYLFDDRFGRPGKGNDKGKVEGLVGYARRNFFVPVPRFASWDALNLDLASKCRERRGRRLRRHAETIGERFARDRHALLPLPPVPYDACDTRPTRVTSWSLVRYRRNDYSVPTAYGHRAVVGKGYVDDVVIVCGSEEIARHRRSYDREALIFDPRPYLALLERKTGAFDQAAPLAGWALPDEFLRRSMAKRGRQANLSFFEFTATPKHKTLAVFGRGGDPIHRYTMHQSIEEGFILDVLKHYTTYATYYKLLKACDDDPNVKRKQAARALARFLRLHPHNIAQKTEVMVEHFHTVTRHKIGGRAKAMVVTGSRLEAVRYKQSFDRYIQEKGYAIRTLVAFSGTVQDDKLQDVAYTEEKMNLGIREKELPEKFATQEYQVLLVAEKYQTGFDQPLLHTMYVDKRLAGIQAVQSLSRLNRTQPYLRG